MSDLDAHGDGFSDRLSAHVAAIEADEGLTELKLDPPCGNGWFGCCATDCR